MNDQIDSFFSLCGLVFGFVCFFFSLGFDVLLAAERSCWISVSALSTLSA